MGAQSVGQVDLRAENVSKIVTGFALVSYVFKQLVSVSSSSAWKETYFQETAADLTASGTGNAVEEIPRLASFPYGQVTWTETSGRQKKHGMEGVISWEDAQTDDVDVIARTLLRIARAVAKSVDTEIWDVLTESRSASAINSVTITAGSEWDSATISNRDPIQNILDAKKEIAIDNYNPDSNGFLLVNPKDFANLLGNANVRNAGQFFTDAVTRNGRVGRILGLTIIVSNNVTADYAAVVVAKECGNWKSVQDLTTETIRDPGIKWTIRSWEIGQCQLTNPQAVCLISNTAK
jgi:hypothetical protein